MINLIAFIFTIGLLVVVHELGHYLAAKSVGVKVEKFYIGLIFVLSLGREMVGSLILLKKLRVSSLIAFFF